MNPSFPKSTPRTLYVTRIVLALPKVQLSLVMNMAFITTRINPDPRHFFSLN